MKDYAYEDLDMVAARELEENEKYEAQCAQDDYRFVAQYMQEPVKFPEHWIKGCLEAALKDEREPAVKAFIATVLGRWYQAHPEMKK